MKSAFYYGTVAHRRYLPKDHRFRYPFFMWFLNLDQIEQVEDIGPWFSTRRFALSRFKRSDYLGPDEVPLCESVKEKMLELTGQPVLGEVCGLINVRTLGLYFSPVNFYFGYDAQASCTHLLAEVSNTPWNERHYYAHDLTVQKRPLVNPKQFHVSPFNPLDQEYRWYVEPPEDSASIKIEVHDQRGHVFDAEINLKKRALTRSEIRPQLVRKPVMTAFIMVGIYWQALKIFLKKIPYIPYKKGDVMNAITSPRQIPLVTAKATPVQAWARQLILRMLIHLHHGQLVVKEDHQTMTFGADDKLKATIYVREASFYSRVLLSGSIGAGESYVDGLWDTDDLTAVVRILVANQDVLGQVEGKLAWLKAPVYRLRHLLSSNNKKGSKKNILAHYDLGNAMYQSFLDPTMMYSSAIYPRDNSPLEEASLHKLDVICRRLKLKPGDQVIEIGSGWGGFAIHAAQNYGCHVTTTTISDAQYEEARRRIAELKLENRITLLKKDYRDLEGRFDKLVSIEMIEAVGHRYLPGFIEKCSSLLKDDGMMLIQAITLQDQLYKNYLRAVDFIQHHIFPGGCLLSNQHLLTLVSKHSDMVVRGLDDFGNDYARTLAEWRTRFLNAFSDLKEIGYDERFKRLWTYYFGYCEGGFREGSISVVHLMATKPRCLPGQFK